MNRLSRNKEWATWIRRGPQVPADDGGGRVLLISYMFPPTGGSAVQRPAKLAKYLPQLGWTVEVLTAAHNRFPSSDESLLADIPAHCRVHRVPGYEPACLARKINAVFHRESRTDWRGPEQDRQNRHQPRRAHSSGPRRLTEDRIYWRLAKLANRLDLSNGESLWIGPAARAAAGRHEKSPFDAMISTGPPHLAHRVAMRIARATNLPWVADVRDPLVSDYDRTPQSRRHAAAMRRLEQAIMRRASIVVTTCPSLAHDLRTRYPRRSPENLRAITNGFDRDDLHGIAGMSPSASGPGDECVFAAVGSFYGRREIARIVEPLQRVLDEHPPWRGRVRLVIAGTIDKQQERRWQREAPEWMTLAGYLDHPSAIRLAANAACTIVVVPDCEHGRVSVPGKTFELLALPAHLLALAPPGSDTERIVADAGASSRAPLEDAGRVASAMERIVREHLRGRLAARRNWPALDIYDRRMIAAEFADGLSRACGRIRQDGSRSCCQACEETGPRPPTRELRPGRPAGDMVEVA